jgi:hypothetical protein
MPVQWEVTSFLLSAHDTVLFANGNMQVATNITIGAVDTSNCESYRLSDYILQNLELVDYYTDEKLTGGWTYTDKENEFGHSMPSSLSNTNDAIPDDTADVVHETADSEAPRTKRYWISTTKLETKVIAARIPQSDGKVISSNAGHFNSSVTIKGTEPVNYGLFNTEWCREDTSKDYYIEQENYFLRSKRYNFKKVDRSGLKSEKYVIPGLRSCTAHHLASTYHFMWDMGPQTTRSVGVDCYESGWIHPLGILRMHTITIRQHANALGLTRCKLLDAPTDVFKSSWWYATAFRIYDIYGNFGDFSVDCKKADTISIQDRNVLADDANLDDKIFYGEENEEDTKLEVDVNVKQVAKATIPVTKFPEGEPSDINSATT